MKKLLVKIFGVTDINPNSKKEIVANIVPQKKVQWKFPPTMEEQKNNFFALWQKNIGEFNAKFPDLVKAIVYFGGTVSGSVAYQGWRYANDTDIFFENRDAAEAFIKSLKKSPYYVGVCEVPVEWGDKQEPGYKGRMCTTTVVKRTELKDGFKLTSREMNTNCTNFLHINVVEKIFSPEELIDQSEKTKNYFEIFLGYKKTNVIYVSYREECSNRFEDGEWHKEFKRYSENVSVKTAEEAASLLEQKKENAIKGEFVVLKYNTN